jgi:hypothetical protein
MIHKLFFLSSLPTPRVAAFHRSYGTGCGWSNLNVRETALAEFAAELRFVRAVGLVRVEDEFIQVSGSLLIFRSSICHAPMWGIVKHVLSWLNQQMCL